MYDTRPTLTCKALSEIAQKKYDAFVALAIDDRLICPACGNGAGLKRHAAYLRHLYLNSIQRFKIWLVRVRCGCGRTFAILPPEIIPFKRYLLDVVLTAVRAAQRTSAYAVQRQMDIDIGLVYYWLKQFHDWHQAFYDSLRLSRLRSPWDCAIQYNSARPAHRLMQVLPQVQRHLIPAVPKRFHALSFIHIL